MEQEEAEERELVSLIPEIVALLGGILSAIIIAVPISFLFNVLPNIQAIGPIFVAPIVEEPAKILGVIVLALYYPDAIENKKRGLILGAMAGLGFAFSENLMYFIMIPQTILLRSIVPVLLHVCASAIAGLGVALLSKKVSRSLKGVSRLKQLNTNEVKVFLTLAILIHFVNNAILMLGASDIMWAANIVIDYLILYKLYFYLPEKLTDINVKSTLGLLISAITSKEKKHERQATIGEFK